MEHPGPAAAEPGTSPETTARPERSGLKGTLVLAYWLSDGVVFGIPVVLLAAWLNALIVFVVAAAVLVPINIACCRWLDRHWEGWMASHGKRIENKLQKLRKG